MLITSQSCKSCNKMCENVDVSLLCILQHKFIVHMEHKNIKVF